VKRSSIARILPWSAIAVLPALIVFGPVACKEPTPGPAAVDTVTLSPNNVSLVVTATQPLVAQPYDRSGTALQSRVIDFQSQNTTIATVTPSGTVVGVAIGTTVITATSEGKVGRATVRVVPDPVTRVTVSPPGGQVAVEGEKRALTAYCFNAKGDSLTDRTIQWTTSNPLVAVVASTGPRKGEVTTVKAGQVNITADCEGAQSVSQFQVIASRVPVANVKISPAGPQILRVGGKLLLTGTPVDVDGTTLTGRTVTWISTNPLVASVDPVSGLVTTVAPGSASIVADCEGKTNTSAVTVTLIPISSVTINPRNVNLFETAIQQLTLTVKDTTGAVIALTGRSVSWSTLEATIAAINPSNFVLGGITPGTTYVKVTVDQVLDSTAVNVKKRNVSNVFIQEINIPQQKVGNSVLLHAVALDSVNTQLPGRTITWGVSDSTKASITSLGFLTAIAAGNITVSAASEGKSDARPVTIIP
jgi:trimeric autotransporter adhesin